MTPRTFHEWNQLLQKMDPNAFIRAYHLKKADEQWHDQDTSSWENLKKYVRAPTRPYGTEEVDVLDAVSKSTEQGYVGYRSQIKQGIESAMQPTVQLNF